MSFLSQPLCLMLDSAGEFLHQATIIANQSPKGCGALFPFVDLFIGCFCHNADKDAGGEGACGGGSKIPCEPLADSTDGKELSFGRPSHQALHEPGSGNEHRPFSKLLLPPFPPRLDPNNSWLSGLLHFFVPGDSCSKCGFYEKAPFTSCEMTVISHRSVKSDDGHLPGAICYLENLAWTGSPGLSQLLYGDGRSIGGERRSFFPRRPGSKSARDGSNSCVARADGVGR